MLALIAAIVIPLVRRNELPRLSLAADSQLADRLHDQADGRDAGSARDAALRCAGRSRDWRRPARRSAIHANRARRSAPTTPELRAAPEPASAAKPIFEEQLDNGWSNWSWGSTIDVAAKTAHAGSAAIGVTYTDGWSGLYLHANQPLDSSGYDTLRFWANGGSAGGQQIRVCFVSSCDQASATYTLEANTWKSYDIPLSDVGAASAAERFDLAECDRRWTTALLSG